MGQTSSTTAPSVSEDNSSLSSLHEEFYLIVRPPMEYIYVLQLTNSKWYVGRTTDVTRRLREHVSGGDYCPAWIKHHPVLGLHSSRVQTSPFDEEMVTKEYMLIYGIDQVRGAKYVKLRLPVEQIRELYTSFASLSHTTCQRCCRPGHVANGCRASVDINGTPLGANTRPPSGSRKLITLEFTSDSTALSPTASGSARSSSPPRHAAGVLILASIPEAGKSPRRGQPHCKRCHSTEHWTTACTAERDVNGEPISTCGRCGHHGHGAGDCTYKTNKIAIS